MTTVSQLKDFWNKSFRPSNRPSPKRIAAVEEMPQIRSKKSVPDPWIYASNHVLVNKARASRRLPSLQRSLFLDNLARVHAEAMAEKCELFHSVKTIDELRLRVSSDHAGQNIQRGKSIRAMHRVTMRASDKAPQKRNMFGKAFVEFGMATAKGKDGQLYMVQIYRGPEIDSQGLENSS